MTERRNGKVMKMERKGGDGTGGSLRTTSLSGR